MSTLLEKLEIIAKKYDELGQRMADPSIHNDPKEFQRIAREHASIREVVEKYYQYRDTLNGIEGAKNVLAYQDYP